MRTQTSYLLIGIFVVSGIVLLTAAVVALSAGARNRDVIKAETLFEESVSGLEVGAPVRFRGVTVGRVTQITVAGALYQETQHTYVVVRFELWGPDGFPIARLRETVPPLEQDRYLAPDLAEAANLIREGELVAAVAPELLAEVAP